MAINKRTIAFLTIALALFQGAWSICPTQTEKAIAPALLPKLDEKCQGPDRVFAFDFAGQTAYNVDTTNGRILFTPTAGNIGNLRAQTSRGIQNFSCNAMYVKIPAEHIFVVASNGSSNLDGRSDLHPNNRRYEAEMQIYCPSTDASTGLTGAAISVVYSTDYVSRSGNPSIFNGLSSLSSPATIDLAPMAANLFTRDPNFAKNTKYFTYEGGSTLTNDGCPGTYQWYVFDKIHPINASTWGVFAQTLGITGNSSSVRNAGGNALRVDFTRGGPDGIEASGCWPASYFELMIRENWGLWVLIGTMCAYFIVALSLNNDTDKIDDDTKWRNNTWTLHPWYSVLTIGTEIYTKSARLAVLFLNMISVQTASAIAFEISSKPDQPINILYMALISVFIAIVPTYFFGFILHTIHRLQKRRYALADNTAEGSLNTAYFFFYILGALYAIGMMSLYTWFMGGRNKTESGYWFASFWLAYAIDWLILDPICCVLAGAVPALLSLFRMRGFYFDYETFVAYSKLEQNESNTQSG